MNREDYMMLSQNIIYFDNGATSLKPKCVIDAMNDYYNNYSSNAFRGDYDIAYKTNVKIDDTRELAKDFINASKKEEIIFTSGTTESLNIIANGYFKNILNKDDEILITKSEHASNILPWFNLCNEIGCSIKYIDLEDNKVILENVIKAVSNKTRVISLAYITNVLGDVRPIKEICEYAHSKGIYVVVDAAQSIAHIKCDVKNLDIDFMAFSSHKMFGPTGVGVLYGRYEYLDKIKPLNLGGGMNESFDSLDSIIYKELPNRLEAGTLNIAGIIGFGEAIKYINNIGINNINKYEIELKNYLLDKLSKIDFIDIYNLNSDSSIVAFNVNGIFSQDVAFYLNKYNICVRSGNHCAKLLKDIIGVKNTIRISLSFYNTKEEIDTLVELLKDKNRILKEML